MANLKKVVSEFNDRIDAVRFQHTINGQTYYGLMTLTAEKLDDILENGYDYRADVQDITPLKKDEGDNDE